MGLFSNFARRVGARPLSRYSIPTKGGAYFKPEKQAKTPSDMHIKSVRNLARKRRVAQRRNETRLRKGKPMRRYLAVMQGAK